MNTYLNQLKEQQQALVNCEVSMFLVKDNSNKSINDFILQATNGIQQIISNIDNIINNNDEIYQKANNLVLQPLYDGLNLLCNSRITNNVPREYYTKQVEIINDAIQLCNKINRHLYVYKITK